MQTFSLAELLTLTLYIMTATLLVVALNVRREWLRRTAGYASIVVGLAATLCLLKCYTGEADLWFETPSSTASRSSSKPMRVSSGSNAGSGTIVEVHRAGGASAVTNDAGGHGASDGNGGVVADGGGAPSGLRLFFASFAGRRQGPSLKPFRDCPDCPEMVPIPPGFAMLGASKGDVLAEAVETPQRSLRIDRMFAIGRYEVTNAEYQAFLKATKRPAPGC